MDASSNLAGIVQDLKNVSQHLMNTCRHLGHNRTRDVIKRGVSTLLAHLLMTHLKVNSP